MPGGMTPVTEALGNFDVAGDCVVTGTLKSVNDLIIGGDSSDAILRFWENNDGWTIRHKASNNYLIFANTLGGAEYFTMHGDGYASFGGNPYVPVELNVSQTDAGNNCDFMIEHTRDNAILEIAADTTGVATGVDQDAIIYFYSGSKTSAKAEIRFDNDHASGQALEINAETLGGHQLVLHGNGNVSIGGDVANLMLEVGGAVAFKRIATAVSDNTAAMGEAHIYAVTSTASARTITISTADIIAGRQFVIKDESGAAGTNNITIDTEGSEKIDGVDTVVISTNYGSVNIYSDGTNLFIY
jgi:hypothetical protein